jgi:hypothetical protein
LQRRKRPDTEHVKIFSQYRRGILYVFYSTAAHDSFFFKLQRPSFLPDVKNNRLHPEVGGGDLRTQSRAHAGIEKKQSHSFIRTQCPVPERVSFVVERLAHQSVDIRRIFNSDKIFHVSSSFSAVSN